MVNIRETILVIEDKPEEVQLLTVALKEAGVGEYIRAVADGRQAIEYLAGVRGCADPQAASFPRLIFLDLKLPTISGLDVLRWIREREEYSGVVVIVLTASDNPADITQAYQAGANSVLGKPTDASDLLTLVKSTVDYWKKTAHLTGTSEIGRAGFAARGRWGHNGHVYQK